jgi:membrane protease YdiL (CAAX protease family)
MRAMLLVALCFACMGIYDGLNYLLPQQIKNLRVQTPELFVIFYDVLIFALPAVIFVNVFPLERFGYFRINKPVPWLTVLLGALSLVLLIPAHLLGAAAIERSITDPALLAYLEALRKANEGILLMPTIGSFLFWLFASGFVTAFCEELFFRAGLQQILMERTGNKFFPIIITAVLFTLFHANPVSLPFIFLAGLILGYAFYRTGSLRMTILMHFLFNGTELFLEFQAQRHLSVRLWTPGVLLASVGVMGAALCIFLLWKRTEHSKI